MTVSLANRGQVVVGCQGEDVLLGDVWRQDGSRPLKVVAEPGAVIELDSAEVEQLLVQRLETGEPLRRDREPSEVGVVLTVELVGSFQRVLVAEDDLGVGRPGV